MKFSDVTKEDMRMIAQLINMVQASKYDISGKDVCASADTIRYLQNMAVNIAKSYQAAAAQGAGAVASEPSAKPEGKVPSSPLGDGIKLNAFNPGTPPPIRGKAGARK